MRAIIEAEQTLLACLPPGAPPSFRKIVSARYEGSGKRQRIVAELEMFDGLPATVTLSRWSLGWSHRFTDMPGGDCTYEDGRWVRVGLASLLY